MFVAGIDVGSKTAKAVILDRDIVASSVIPVENTWRVEAERVLGLALSSAGISRKDLELVVGSGVISEDWEGADDYLSEVSCAANGVNYYFPQARTIIDIGAESSLCSKCDEAGIVLDYVANQKCGSGSGIFLEVIAGILETDVLQIGELALNSKKEIQMNSTCAVFAESEVVSLIAQGETVEDILNAVHSSIVSRTAAMIRTIKLENEAVFIGGVARNAGMAHSLSKALGVDIRIPPDPEMIIALGASIEARELL